MNFKLYVQYIVLQMIYILPKSKSLNITQDDKMYGSQYYNLEHHCINNDEKEFFVENWKGAIFQVGSVMDQNGLPLSRKIHKCKITIKANKDFWLVAAIEHMKLRGERDSSNKWTCEDYVQFFSAGKNLVGKLLNVFDLESFTAKRSEKLCGMKQLVGDISEPIYDLSTDANSFSTSSNDMSIVFHQKYSKTNPVNNSFTIVVTTFRHASDEVECEGKQKCYGRDVFCIDRRFVCDGHVNCAFPGSGTDEKLCHADKKPSIFNMTSVIIVTLTSMVTFGILLCIISSIVCRVKSRLRSNPRQENAVSTCIPLSSQNPSAPRYEMEETLPPYETVILSDSGEDKNLADTELPPKYESLFPEETPSKFKDSKDNPDR